MVDTKADHTSIVDSAEKVSQYLVRGSTSAIIVAILSVFAFVSIPATVFFAFNTYKDGWIWPALSVIAFGVGAASFVVTVSISVKQAVESEAREWDRDLMLTEIRDSALSAARDAHAARVASEDIRSRFVHDVQAAQRERGIAGSVDRPSLERLAEEVFLRGAGVSVDDVPRVLWVDDHPDNNFFERSALQEAGVIVEISFSTDEALERMRAVPFDLVISDMERRGRVRAGYELLEEMRRGGLDQPFVVYAGETRPEYLQETLALGGDYNTSDPFVLISEVAELLRDGRRS